MERKRKKRRKERPVTDGYAQLPFWIKMGGMGTVVVVKVVNYDGGLFGTIRTLAHPSQFARAQ